MRLFRHSRLDALPALFALAQWPAMLAWAASAETLPVAAHLALILPAALLFYTNPIVVTHNFLHTPFFAWRPLNVAFSVFNSGNMMLPQCLYRHHHLLHHRFNNDPIVEGTTRDPSSTFRFGREGRHEGMVAYCALSLFRDATGFAFAELRRKNELSLFVAQLLMIALTLGLWLWLSWRWTLGVALPVFYLGWFFAHMENYYEHRHATAPTVAAANSVSYLGPIYNVVMLNEGYHQAHHLRPGSHWTRRPEVQDEFAAAMAEARSFVAAWPPLLGFLERGVARDTNRDGRAAPESCDSAGIA